MKVGVYADNRVATCTFIIKIRISHRGKNAYISTDVKLTADQWDAKNERVTGNRRLTSYINSLVERTETAARAFLNDNKAATACQLRDAATADLYPERVTQTTLAILLDDYAATCTAKRTQEIYHTTAKVIRTFGDIPPTAVTHSWLSALDSALRQKGRKANTIAIHMRNIRAVLNRRLADGKEQPYPFRTFHVRHEETIHRVLDVEQLRLIINTGDYFADLFALSFFLMGINTADLYALTENNIHGDRLIYRRQKTGRVIDIRIEPEAASIIERNRGRRTILNTADRYSTAHNLTVAWNKRLKVFGDITVYHARHTWATIAYSLGIPLDTISRALGHSFVTGAAVTAVYVRTGTEDIDKANRRVIDYVTKTAATPSYDHTELQTQNKNRHK